MTNREFVDSREGFEDCADYEMYLDQMEENARLSDANGELNYVGFAVHVFNGLVELSLEAGELLDAGPIDEMLGVHARQ